MESSVHPLFFSLGFSFCCCFQNLGSGILLHHFLSISEQNLEAETWGLQCSEFESPAAASTINYFLRKRTIFMFMLVLISYISFFFSVTFLHGLSWLYFYEKIENEKCESLEIKPCYWIVFHITNKIETFVFTSQL